MASGGSGSTFGGDGGKGGAGTTPAGQKGSNNDDGGGGGGAVGRIRVNAGTPSLSGTVSPSASQGTLLTQPLP
jgi:hypothetical protein